MAGGAVVVVSSVGWDRGNPGLLGMPEFTRMTAARPRADGLVPRQSMAELE
jgi:hypothetical protein